MDDFSIERKQIMCNKKELIEEIGMQIQPSKYYPMTDYQVTEFRKCIEAITFDRDLKELVSAYKNAHSKADADYFFKKINELLDSK
jgi:hypothetical protein